MAHGYTLSGMVIELLPELMIALVVLIALLVTMICVWREDDLHP